MSPDETEIPAALTKARELADAFFAGLETRSAARPFPGAPPVSLHETGTGAVQALTDIWERYGSAFSGSTGPRYWGFVNGGATPASIAADWLCSAIDQTGQMFGDNPSVAIEHETMAMLRDLFELPPAFEGMFVSGGSMANFTGLAVGVQRVGAKFGVDVSREGVQALRPIHVLTGECHSSTTRACGMLGLGRNAVEQLPLERGRERVDVSAVAKRVRDLKGEPIIIVGNAATVTTGDFDDIDGLADLAEESGAHLHVDGAFGLFARVSPKYSALAKGVERADTIASDAHKWLNVPYDSGLVFSRHRDHQTDMFKNESPYLPSPEVDALNYPNLVPENSRRLRALPAWATLQAYGREGYRHIVEKCCALAHELRERLETEAGFRLAAPVHLNVVCFELLDDAGNCAAETVKPFIAALIRDGRVRVSASMFEGRPCARLALVNWRTQPNDLDVAMEAFRACRQQVIRYARHHD